MGDKIITFDSVIIDKEEKTFTVLDGNVGTYSIKDIKTIQILGERASKRGKTEPFTYTVLLSHYFGRGLFFEPAYYVGLKIDMINGEYVGVYLHKKKTYTSTDISRKAIKEGEKIRKILYKYREDN